MTKFAIGLDFGTESGRALVVDVATGRAVGSAVYRYAEYRRLHDYFGRGENDVMKRLREIRRQV